MKIAFIGGGNMAAALIGGLIKRGVAASGILAIDVNADARARTEQQFGIRTAAAIDAALADYDAVVLAVKPQVLKDVEQAAFTPANVVPGIGFSPDRLLQGRLFSYGDTQRYRLGVNHHQIPVNAPRCPFHAAHRDGAMRTDGNLGGHANYEPNRFGDFAQDRHAREPALQAGAVDHYDHREDADYYSQPAALFRLFDAGEKARLFGNIARHIHGVPQDIVARAVEHFAKIDPAYADGVKAALAELAK